MGWLLILSFTKPLHADAPAENTPHVLRLPAMRTSAPRVTLVNKLPVPTDFVFPSRTVLLALEGATYMWLWMAINNMCAA